jgi:hypothetical protein
MAKQLSTKIRGADIHNQAAFRRLHAVLKQPIKPIAFVGAGISVDAGYPDWRNLLDQLHKRAFPINGNGTARADIARSKDGLWRAEVYKQTLGARYAKALTDIITHRDSSRKSHDLAKHVAGLSFAHYLTTNYETVLAHAISRSRNGLDPLEVDAQETGDMRRFLAEINRADLHVIYLHGRIAAPETIVLTESDYLKRYRGTQRAERELFAVLATREVVFVGFSLNDPDLAEILRVMRGEESGEPRHFALLPLENADDESVLREYYRLKYGVETIFYLKTDNHRPLLELLQLLGSESVKDERIPVIGAAVTRVSGSKVRPQPIDPDDPQKGMWGGKSSRNGRKVEAAVAAVQNEREWFEINIKVMATDSRPILGPVYIHVHDSFDRPYYMADFVTPKRLCAELTLHAYGAFTLGVVCDDGATTLELDLAKLKNAPKVFREN